MKHLMLFESFLNEFRITSEPGQRKNHWGEERGDMENPKSRIRVKSQQFVDGWTCQSLIETDKRGRERINSNISLQDFLAKSGMTFSKFEEKTTFSLSALVKSKKVKETDYIQMEKDIQRTVILKIGKLIFEVNDKFYSPVLEVEKGAGNTIWGVVRNNMGVTFKYEHSNVNVETLKRRDYDNLRNPRTGQHYMSWIAYDDNCEVKNLYSDNLADTFSVVITDNPDWKREVKEQCDKGYSLYAEKPEKAEKDPLRVEWEALYPVTVAQSTNKTVVDKGTVIYRAGGPGVIAGYENGNYFLQKGSIKSVFSVKEGSTISIREKNPALKDKFFTYDPMNMEMVSLAKSEKEWNELLSNAELFKVIKMEKLPVKNNVSKKLEITGPIVNRFIVVKDKRVDFKHDD